MAELAVGAVVCISAAAAGDTSQDLKTGFLVGATPARMQWERCSACWRAR